jgi:hypothetical protein
VTSSTRRNPAFLDHPNIARVLDAGTTDGGRPFFVIKNSARRKTSGQSEVPRTSSLLDGLNEALHEGVRVRRRHSSFLRPESFGLQNVLETPHPDPPPRKGEGEFRWQSFCDV